MFSLNLSSYVDYLAKFLNYGTIKGWAFSYKCPWGEKRFQSGNSTYLDPKQTNKRKAKQEIQILEQVQTES